MALVNAAAPVQLETLEAPCWVLETWTLRPGSPFRSALPPDWKEPLPLSELTEKAAGPTRVERLVDPAEVGKSLQLGAAAGARLELSKTARAGGRLLAWREGTHLWFEDATYGSGLPIVERLDIVPEYRGELTPGETLAVPLDASDRIDAALLRGAPFHTAIHVDWFGEPATAGPHGVIVRVVSVDRSTGQGRPVRVSVVLQAVGAF